MAQLERIYETPCNRVIPSGAPGTSLALPNTLVSDPKASPRPKSLNLQLEFFTPSDFIFHFPRYFVFRRHPLLALSLSVLLCVTDFLTTIGTLLTPYKPCQYASYATTAIQVLINSS